VKRPGGQGAEARGKSKPREPLFEGSEWTFEKLHRTYSAIEEIALGDLGLEVYPNQIEVISSEQMLDAYSSIGMPLMYQHWSFGKHFLREEGMYRKGFTGLAYEIVINSNPCISYNMEENSMAIQALVMAHAAFGHNHFFRNNYLFRQWTDADGILEYLQFAKSYIAKCEERYGPAAVEEILDAAHALMDHGVFRYRRPTKLSKRAQVAREKERLRYEERTFQDIWRTVPKCGIGNGRGDGEGAQEKEKASGENDTERGRKLNLPEENLLYFIEKNSPVLETWQREILRIVRNIAQYFYPQKQTKVMNEGCATFVHNYIMNRLYDDGRLTDGAMLEILHSHSNVIFQPDFDDPRYSGINPYALGLAMMEDIKRICVEPTEEDRTWFPEIAGNGDWRGTLRHAWANYRDESFIQQYLSPHLIRKLKLFLCVDEAEKRHVLVASIHDERGYKAVRTALARSYDLGLIEPDVQVVSVDMSGDRRLHLRHAVRDGIPLSEQGREKVLAHVRRLWGYEVELAGVDKDTGETLYESSTAKPAVA